MNLDPVSFLTTFALPDFTTFPKLLFFCLSAKSIDIFSPNAAMFY